MSRQRRLAAYRAATACARQRNAAATLAQAAQDLHRETLDLSLRCMSADDAQVTIGEYGKVLRHDERTEIIQCA